jgi:predicted transcriptional regulator with HTH domain/transposase
MSAITMKSERIGRFRIFAEQDRHERVVKTVYLDYIPVARFYQDDINERKLAAIELVERCHCSQRIAGKICGFHRNTVFKLLRTKRLLGIEAVFEEYRGLKEAYKYIGKIRSHIKKLLRKYPDWSDQSIAEQASKDLNMEISRSAVARIRTEKEDHKKGKKTPSKAALIAIARVADAVDKRNFDEGQLQLNLTWNKELKETSEACAKEPAPTSESRSEQQLIERLQKGERCNFSGALIHHLFLEEIGFKEIMSVFSLNPGATYQSQDIMGVLFHSINLGIASIESLKLVNASELGVLLGMTRTPDKETVRDHLNRMAEEHLSGELIDRFAQGLLQQGFIDPQVFFIDGHFLPYYGLHIIAKGYYTVRRLAMRGNELYAISDLQGRVLFYMTESNEIDFRPIISRCAAKLRDYGIVRPILVFDRGGYGVHFFKELHETADFVTWAKYISSKNLAGIPDSSFRVGIYVNDKKYLVAEQMRTVSESAQTAKQAGRSTPTSLELRLIILEDVATKERVGILTNNTDKPFYKIAYYMLQRWGDSENVFKEMMARFHLNYHPGYEIKELENQPLVDNPDIALMKKALRILQKEVKALEEEILLIQAKQMQRRDRRREAKLVRLNESIAEKKEDITGFEEKLSQLPDKVSIIDLLQGKRMNRCDLEKKKLYDLMQFAAFNSRERLAEIFRECYDDPRDVKQVLDMITSRAGYIKLVGQTLIVILDWIENKKHREAAERFCRILNKKEIRLVGRLNVKVSFYVSQFPQHGSKAASTSV